MKQELASTFPFKFPSIKLSKNIPKPSRKLYEFLWNFYKSKKQVKKRKNCKEKGPGPKGNGSWIIQTHQERWIDPAPSNPRSNGQNAGKAEPG
jgi:hypothetical protein